LSFRSMVERGVRERWLVLCVVLIVAACGKRGGGAGPSVGSGSAVLTMPRASEVPAGLTVTVLRSGELPASAKARSTMLEAHYKVVAVVDVGPPTAVLPASSTLAITIDPARILPEYEPKDLTAVQLQPAGKVADLPIRVVSGHRVDVTMDKVGTVLVIGPLEKLTVLGSTADVLRGSTETLMQGDCPTWITPGSAKVAALAKDLAGLVIGADHAIQLGTKLLPGQTTGKRQRADEILTRGTADPVDASVVLASVLLAKGHPVRLVSGTMTYEHAGRRHAGVQQWAEVVRDGQPWFVDARDVATPRLVPLAEASENLGLRMSRSCPAYPPGASVDPGQWTPPAPVPAPATPPSP
jgi:transglutaminase-like putative cysteine protease